MVCVFKRHRIALASLYCTVLATRRSELASWPSTAVNHSQTSPSNRLTVNLPIGVAWTSLVSCLGM